MQVLSFRTGALHNCVWLAGSRLAGLFRFCRPNNKAISGVSTLKSHSRLELGSLWEAKLRITRFALTRFHLYAQRERTST